MHAKNSQAINTNCGLKLKLTCEEDCVCATEYIHEKKKKWRK